MTNRIQYTLIRLNIGVEKSNFSKKVIFFGKLLIFSDIKQAVPPFAMPGVSFFVIF